MDGTTTSVTVFRMSVLSASTQRSKRDNLVGHRNEKTVRRGRRLLWLCDDGQEGVVTPWDASDSACVHVQKGGR